MRIQSIFCAGLALPVVLPLVTAVRADDAAPAARPTAPTFAKARHLERGGVIELQLHDTAVAGAARDRTRAGIVFSKDPRQR